MTLVVVAALTLIAYNLDYDFIEKNSSENKFRLARDSQHLKFDTFGQLSRPIR